MVKFLVQNLGAKVNYKIKLVELLEPDIECSAAGIAVMNDDAAMLRLLARDLGARVNDQIWVDGKPTTIVHVALQTIHK